eukprot:6194082-Pleurochrysis_carterae.AAC.1
MSSSVCSWTKCLACLERLMWAAMDGAQAASPQAAAAGKARASGVDEVWLLGSQREPATWQRLASLRALGVHVGDKGALLVERVADFLAGVADVADGADHAAVVLRTAAQEAAQAGKGALVVAGDSAQRGLAAAGRDCVATLASLLNALGKRGEAQ